MTVYKGERAVISMRPQHKKIHTKFQAGGCRVDIYSVKKCTKCGAIKDRVKSNSITYAKCIHKG